MTVNNLKVGSLEIPRYCVHVDVHVHRKPKEPATNKDWKEEHDLNYWLPFDSKQEAIDFLEGCAALARSKGVKPWGRRLVPRTGSTSKLVKIEPDMTEVP